MFDLSKWNTYYPFFVVKVNTHKNNFNWPTKKITTYRQSSLLSFPLCKLSSINTNSVSCQPHCLPLLNGFNRHHSLDKTPSLFVSASVNQIESYLTFYLTADCECSVTYDYLGIALFARPQPCFYSTGITYTVPKI